MENKLYVGNLSYDTENEGLQAAFEQFGEVTDVRIIRDRDTGRSKGFGFITFASEEAAKAGLEMSGQEVDGRQLRVNVAQDKPRR